MRSRLAFRRSAAVLALALLPGAGLAQSEAPIVGRWDLTVHTRSGPVPSWLEVSASGHSTLVGRFVGEVGSARPVSRVDFDHGTLRLAIPAQWERGDGDLRVSARLDGDALQGSITLPSGEQSAFSGVRAPLLRRSGTPRWGAPIRLFNGRDLSGWRVTDASTSQWRAIGGILANAAGGANLVTERAFGDFKLHLEFRYPPQGNSGVFLRGRHEVQIEDSGEREPTPLVLGAVYGFLTPSQRAGKRPGEWQTFDITLVGRRVTVVLNGVPIIVDQTIPGITGGALDSDEGAPGPICLQGDHTAVEYRRITIAPAR